MTLKQLKRKFALLERNDLGQHFVVPPSSEHNNVRMDAYVTEIVMRMKTTGKKTVRFRVYTDMQWLILFATRGLDGMPNTQMIREAIELGAISAVRQVLDQL